VLATVRQVLVLRSSGMEPYGHHVPGQDRSAGHTDAAADGLEMMIR